MTGLDLQIQPVVPTHPDVVKLIEQLNRYQIDLYGIEHCNLESPASLQANQALMLGAFYNNTLVGIGAIKLLGTYAEIKRMYVDNHYRGQSIAAQILQSLESIAFQKGIRQVCLETGYLHHAAIAFYNRSGYVEVERFGNYTPNGVSVYFQKTLPER